MSIARELSGPCHLSTHRDSPSIATAVLTPPSRAVRALSSQVPRAQRGRRLLQQRRLGHVLQLGARSQDDGADVDDPHRLRRGSLHDHRQGRCGRGSERRPLELSAIAATVGVGLASHSSDLLAGPLAVLAGVSGLLFRGLVTKIISNGCQGILFSVLWRMGQDAWDQRQKENAKKAA